MKTMRERQREDTQQQVKALLRKEAHKDIPEEIEGMLNRRELDTVVAALERHMRELKLEHEAAMRAHACWKAIRDSLYQG
jgi:hypothetical protein